MQKNLQKIHLASEGTNLAALAQQFYKKPQALGGGGNAFNTGGPTGAGFVIPPKLVQSGTGATWGINVAPQNVLFTSTVIPNSGYTWQVRVYTTADSIGVNIQ
jgi:hypothetical protein